LLSTWIFGGEGGPGVLVDIMLDGWTVFAAVLAL
jgi:hypothetical protein